ncbi:hypothetical protein Pcinc_005246 [Petrolisthes cinctipes]|uniref:Dynein regulatory complex subunit 2 n=1 Tax=Petrolisthes cinctipes TaxID=88211 RepID=A0AAE1GDR9_PETCI|nr:hypothetical protein Pcinc_005246 [Petrolisthes cinctipes]
MAPKKKGKGKGDKLARMTVEQRQQYLDRRAAQEAESNRRKEELVAGFLKLKLSDEGKKGVVNEAKLMTKWREVLREAKTTSLHTQLQELRQRVKETTDRQNTMIQLLANQVGRAQHQRTQAAHNHLAAVHRLAELHEDTSGSDCGKKRSPNHNNNNTLSSPELHEEHIGLLTGYVREREASMADTAATDTETLAATHLHHLRHHALITHAASRHHALTEKEELAAFHTTMTQITTQLEEEVTAARVEREGALEEAWDPTGSWSKRPRSTHHLTT